MRYDSMNGSFNAEIKNCFKDQEKIHRIENQDK